MPLAL